MLEHLADWLSGALAWLQSDAAAALATAVYSILAIIGIVVSFLKKHWKVSVIFAFFLIGGAAIYFAVLSDKPAFGVRVSSLLSRVLGSSAPTPRPTGSAGQTEIRNSSGGQNCPGPMPSELVLDKGWRDINDGRCNVVFQVIEGDVIFDTKDGERIVGADDMIASQFWLGDILRAKSGTPSARLRYSLCPPETARRKVALDCNE